ncbi:MAG: phosphoglycerate kinase [Myxococcota bacterium]|jgi:phosphoglycerate kinase|nr:phosphoglycerate kinase [Myxococcota bacterium]
MIDTPQIQDLDLTQKNVFMRVDFNVPLRDGVVTSDARIRAALPTIKAIMGDNTKITLASHCGRPRGQRNRKFSMEPIAQRLAELVDAEVLFAEDCIGDSVDGLVREQKSNQIVLLENLRFYAGEEKNDAEFSRKLARSYDVYINDAFGASHRSHASIDGITNFIPEHAAGLLLHKEVEVMTSLRDSAEAPFIALIGGAKVSDKLGVLDALLTRVNVLCIGGAMAYTFLSAQGGSVGASRVESNKIWTARQIIERAEAHDVQLLLPCDHIAMDEFSEDASTQILTSPSLGAESIGVDIGPKTLAAWSEHIREAGTIFWNGPMGVFEWDSCAKGTIGVAQAVAQSKAFSVVGGGDSVAALEKADVIDAITHVSTGGGASLELLEKGSLPGLLALSKKKRG